VLSVLQSRHRDVSACLTDSLPLAALCAIIVQAGDGQALDRGATAARTTHHQQQHAAAAASSSLFLSSDPAAVVSWFLSLRSGASSRFMHQLRTAFSGSTENRSVRPRGQKELGFIPPALQQNSSVRKAHAESGHRNKHARSRAARRPSVDVLIRVSVLCA
jgi:hypothetical protein